MDWCRIYGLILADLGPLHAHGKGENWRTGLLNGRRLYSRWGPASIRDAVCPAARTSVILEANGMSQPRGYWLHLHRGTGPSAGRYTANNSRGAGEACKMACCWLRETAARARSAWLERGGRRRGDKACGERPMSSHSSCCSWAACGQQRPAPGCGTEEASANADGVQGRRGCTARTEFIETAHLR